MKASPMMMAAAADRSVRGVSAPEIVVSPDTGGF
jgi:hypothetical protein